LIELIFTPLDILDSWLAGWLPELARVCIWGMLSGCAAMLIYSAASDQESITSLKTETRNLRARMLKDELQHSEFMSLVKENLLVSLQLLRKVLFPSLTGSLPVLIVAVWLGTHLTYTLPQESEPVTVDIIPPVTGISFYPENFFLQQGIDVRFIPEIDGGPVRIVGKDGLVYSGMPHDHPAPSIQKRKWWNALIGNSAGYIEADSAVEEIRWGFPRKVFIQGVPAWIATWEFPYFMSVFIVAIVLKLGLRIE